MKKINLVFKSFGKKNLKSFGSFKFRSYNNNKKINYKKYEPSSILNNTDLNYDVMIEKEKTERAIVYSRKQDDFKSIIRKMQYSSSKKIPIDKKFYDIYLLATTKVDDSKQFLEALNELIKLKIKPKMGTLFLTLQKLREIDELSKKEQIMPVLDNLRELMDDKELNGETIKILSSMARVLLKRNLIEEAEKIEQQMKQFKYQNEIQSKEKFIYIEINYRKNKDIIKACDYLMELAEFEDDDARSDLFLFLIQVCFDMKEYESASLALKYILQKNIEMKPAILRVFVETYAIQNNMAKLEEVIKLSIAKFAQSRLDQVILANAINNLGEKKKFFPSKLIFQTVMRFAETAEFQKSGSILLKEDLFFNMMLKSAGISEKYDFMEKVLSQMKSLGLELTTYTYNILLYSFGDRLGDYTRTEQLVKEMEKKDIEKNSSTLIIMSDIERKRNKLDSFAEISEKAMKKQFFPSPKVLSNYIMSNALGGNINAAMETLQKLLEDNQVPSFDSCKALVTSIAKSGNFKLAYKYLRLMNERFSYKPNEATSVELLSCCPTFKLEKIRRIFVKKYFVKENSNIINNMLISRFGDEGDFEKATYYFDLMKKTNTADLLSYKTYISRALKNKRIELVDTVYQEMCFLYPPNDTQYRDCIFIDYLFNNTERINTSKIYFKNWNSLLLKNFTYLSFLYIQAGDFQQSVYWLDQLGENKIFLDSNRSTFLLNNFGKTRNNDYLQKLLTYIPSYLFDLSGVKFALCLAHIRVGNLLDCLSIFDSLINHSEVSFNQFKLEILNEIVTFHSNSGNDDGVEKWKQIAISNNLISLDLVNSLLKYYMKTKNLNASFEIMEISLSNKIYLDDTSFFYFFSTISSNKNENYLLAFEYFAKSGTLLDETDLDSDLAKVISPILKLEHKNIFKDLYRLKPTDNIFVGDVLNFLQEIHQKN